ITGVINVAPTDSLKLMIAFDKNDELGRGTIYRARRSIKTNILPQRRSIRLVGYDYSQPGGYYVTIRFTYRSENPTNSRLKRFIKDTFNDLERKHPPFRLDEWILMSDHLHFICFLLDNSREDANPRLILGEYVRRFKAKITYEMHRTDDLTFKWQRNYFERVIRNEKELMKLRRYILNNPEAIKWKNG
ncbi:MAG: transposase, partial [Candidatus Electryoneaceae bacterium]|nr:transposase [Candidatus Electryoneaceae bacterium]